MTSPPQPLASGLGSSEHQARTSDLALLEAEETVHVGATAAVVVGFAHIVPMREKPSWLLKDMILFGGKISSECSHLLVTISMSRRLKTKRRIPIFNFLNLLCVVCSIFVVDAFCYAVVGGHISTK